MTSAQHFARLLELPCIVTNRYGVTRHHILGGSVLAKLGVRGQRKHSDWLALPLLKSEDCDLHQGKPEGIHAGVWEWEARNGTQVALIDKLGAHLGLDLWELAAAERDSRRASRRTKPSPKINAWRTA